MSFSPESKWKENQSHPVCSAASGCDDHSWSNHAWPVTAMARPAKARRSALSEGRSAAFTLRLDAERHLKLRLACALANRSARNGSDGAIARSNPVAHHAADQKRQAGEAEVHIDWKTSKFRFADGETIETGPKNLVEQPPVAPSLPNEQSSQRTHSRL